MWLRTLLKLRQNPGDCGRSSCEGEAAEAAGDGAVLDVFECSASLSLGVTGAPALGLRGSSSTTGTLVRSSGSAACSPSPESRFACASEDRNAEW